MDDKLFAINVCWLILIFSYKLAFKALHAKLKHLTFSELLLTFRMHIANLSLNIANMIFSKHGVMSYC